MIKLMVRELCTNVRFKALLPINVPQKGKNIKRPRNGLWADTNMTFGLKVKHKNLQYFNRTHG